MTTFCDSRFAAMLRKFDLKKLNDHPCAVYGMWSDFTLAYANRAWRDFAVQNGADDSFSERWGLGSNVLEAIGGPLQTYYTQELYACLLSEEIHERTYECSSPDLRRIMRMRTYPLPGGSGLLVVNSLESARPHDTALRPSQAPDCSMYEDSHVFVHQCGECRRVQRAVELRRWDWVPDWVRQPPKNVVQCLCPVCMESYYPMQEDEFGSSPITRAVIGNLPYGESPFESDLRYAKQNDVSSY